jgi:hypothetical protein
MQSLTARELELLVKLCGLFSSHFPDEVAAAAARADKILRERGLTWNDVLRLPIGREIAEAACADGDPFATWPGGWRDACQFVLRHPELLSKWERTFCAKIEGWHSISPKQRPILRDMLDRVLAAGHRP